MYISFPRVYIFRFRRVDSGELRSDGICMAIIIKGHSGLLPNILLSEYPAAAPNGQFIRSVVGLSPCHGAHLTRNPIRILAVSTACGTPCRAGRLPRRRRSGGRPVWGSRRWLSYCDVTVSCAGALLWIYMGRRSCGGCGCNLCGSDALCGDRLFGRLFGGRYAVGAFV